jgi:serine phosphatase RsbU (regulator of sigma subunit)
VNQRAPQGAWLSVNATPMAGGGITHVVSVGKDVTQLRRAAERESTLRLARSVQQRLFPPNAPTVPGFDIYGATFVADVTGGDYYDTSSPFRASVSGSSSPT